MTEQTERTVVLTHNLMAEPDEPEVVLIPAGYRVNVLDDHLAECGYLIVERQDGSVSTAVEPGQYVEGDEAKLLLKARRALAARLARERRVYGMIGPLESMEGDRKPYDGRGDRFEFMVRFDGQWAGHSVYEVTLYSGGKSSRIYEV